MKLIIVGCGRQGAHLAQLLSQLDHSVTVVEADEENLKRLGPNFKGQVIHGVPFDRQNLINAGIERADGLAAVSNNDDANIVTAMLARNIFHVPNVVARVYDLRQLDIYGRLGLQTISPIELGAMHIVHLLTRKEIETVMSFGNGEMEVVVTEVPPQVAGRTVGDFSVPSEVMVVAVTRQSKAFIPTMGTRLLEGDLLHIAVLSTSAHRLPALLGLA
ncbi:MAG: TrkA family potassium uptake protein [Anaerolineae bacterium]